MWVPSLRPFPGNEAHKLFAGGPKWSVLGGGQEVNVENVHVRFRSPNSENGVPSLRVIFVTMLKC